MEVASDENSCLGEIPHSSFQGWITERKASSAEGSLGWGETLPRLPLSTGHTMQWNPRGSQEPPAPKATGAELCLLPPALRRNCSPAALG